MNDLKSISALVQALLEQDVNCRNSDSFLYLRVLFAHAENKGINLNAMTIPDFLMNHHGNDFPIFESVRRTRQKIQQHNPELAAAKIVKEFRLENQAQFLAFVRGELQ